MDDKAASHVSLLLSELERNARLEKEEKMRIQKSVTPPFLYTEGDLWDGEFSSDFGSDDIASGTGFFETPRLGFEDFDVNENWRLPLPDFSSPMRPPLQLVQNDTPPQPPPLKFRKSVDGGKLPTQLHLLPSPETLMRFKHEEDGRHQQDFPSTEGFPPPPSPPLLLEQQQRQPGIRSCPNGRPYPSIVLSLDEDLRGKIAAMKQKAENFFEEMSLDVEKFDQEGRKIVSQQRELVDAWEKGRDSFHHFLNQKRSDPLSLSSTRSSSSSVSSQTLSENSLRTYIEPITQLRSTLKNEISKIQQMSEATILAPEPLDFSRNLTYRIRKLLILLDLCEREIYHLGSLSGLEIGSDDYSKKSGDKNEDHLHDFVALVLKDPPHSQVMFKGKIIEETFRLSLLTSAGVRIEETGEIEAVFPSGSKNVKPAKNGRASRGAEPLSVPCAPTNPIRSGGRGGSVSAVSREFIVRNVKVNISTRVDIVSLMFYLGVNGKWGKGGASGWGEEGRASRSKSKANEKRKKNSFAVTPHPYSIIAITHETQWMEAEYKLLVRDIYQGNDTSSEVGWCFFANCLHGRFLRATKQKSSDPNRPFSPTDWNHFHEKFFGSSQVVTLNQITAFWKWFGPIMQTLRFKKHINALWLNGLLFGIVSKEDCNRELDQQQDGTFIVRFSEGCPGLFAIAFVCDDETGGGRVKHYLVRPEDTSSQKSLPDFLREKYQLKSILKYDYRKQMLQPTEKNIALKAFYSKVKAVDGIGYRCQMY